MEKRRADRIAVAQHIMDDLDREEKLLKVAKGVVDAWISGKITTRGLRDALTYILEQEGTVTVVERKMTVRALDVAGVNHTWVATTQGDQSDVDWKLALIRLAIANYGEGVKVDFLPITRSVVK